MAEYVKGDIIKITRTYEVLGDRHRDGEAWTAVKDVQCGREYRLRTDGSAKVEMVRRAYRPAAGTVIPGRRVKEVQWKRGTIIHCVRMESGATPSLAELVLSADGVWINLDRPIETYKFEDLAEHALFKLIHVA